MISATLVDASSARYSATDRRLFYGGNSAHLDGSARVGGGICQPRDVSGGLRCKEVADISAIGRVSALAAGSAPLAILVYVNVSCAGRNDGAQR